MKLKNIIPQRFRNRHVRQFGQARLVRLPNGQHELIGGTADDNAAAREWCSLFEPEIVFTSDAHLERPTRPARTTIAFAACVMPQNLWGERQT